MSSPFPSPTYSLFLTLPLCIPPSFLLEIFLKIFKNLFPRKVYLYFLNLILWFEFSNFIKICVCRMPKFFQPFWQVNYAICLGSQCSVSALCTLCKTLGFADGGTVYALVHSILKCSLEYIALCHTLCWKWKEDQTPPNYPWKLTTNECSGHSDIMWTVCTPRRVIPTEVALYIECLCSPKIHVLNS